MPRPTINMPDWFVTAPSKRVEPSGAKKLQGWNPGEPYPAQNANWLWYSLSLWLAYIVDLVENGTTAVEVTSTLAIDAEDDRGKIFLIDSSGGAFDLDLPAAATAAGLRFTVKDIGGVLSTNPVTLDRAGSEEFEGVAADYLLESDHGVWEVYCDGTSYQLL